MNLLILSATFTALGEIIIAYTVIIVHHRFMKEHRIDEKVFKTMHKEQKIAFVGISFIALGWALTVIDQLFLV